MSDTVVVLSVDTEEDNWVPARAGITVENIRELPRLQAACDRLGVPVTYFTSYQVASTDWSAAILRELAASGRAEVAAHLHPWNTPPVEETFVSRNTMAANLPRELQHAKVAALTAQLQARTGVRPTAFRCGRFGLGRETVQVLAELGYRTDSSVTPWISWADTDDGPDFVGAPLGPYLLDPAAAPRHPSAAGALLEVPVSSGYSRWPFERAHAIHERLTGAGRMHPIGSLVARLGIMRRVILNPEMSSPRNMLKLARLLVEHRVPHLSLFFHSPCLSPGLTPYARSAADVQRLYRAVAAFIDGLGRFCNPRFTTISQAAALLSPAAHAGAGN